MPTKISFPAFFLMWADQQGWTVPPLHLQICHWLETETARVRVLQVFRGAAKSTIYAIYKAWCLHQDRGRRSIVWAADDKVAGKLTRDTLNVLMRHPLCGSMIKKKPGAMSFWVDGSTDVRNPSMDASGVSSNATSSRCDDADFDDIEVPKNIKSTEMQAQLRTKISEATFILSPGGRKTFIGTPHTHNSIYVEQIKGGAASLTIPLFARSVRYEDPGTAKSFRIPWAVEADGLTVLMGIGKASKLLQEGRDYHIANGAVVFFAPPGITLDLCSGNAWPEYFTADEMLFRCQECMTYNEWDSQYQLEAKPVTNSRLKPERIRAYDLQPVIRPVNGSVSMFLGDVQIVGASAYWDCSLGKIGSDDSVLSLVLTDARGNLYWQCAEAFTGELTERDDRSRIIGGQVWEVRNLVLRYQIPRVEVETNGPGGFVPAILREALKGTGCGVGEIFQTVDKRKRILDAFEAPLSSRFLWAHVDVLNGPSYTQMQQFRPDVRDQPDDYIDSAAGAIAATPVRIGKLVSAPNSRPKDWRPGSGVHTAKLELPGLTR